MAKDKGADAPKQEAPKQEAPQDNAPPQTEKPKTTPATLAASIIANTLEAACGIYVSRRDAGHFSVGGWQDNQARTMAWTATFLFKDGFTREAVKACELIALCFGYGANASQWEKKLASLKLADGVTPRFPERVAATVQAKASTLEAEFFQPETPKA